MLRRFALISLAVLAGCSVVPTAPMVEAPPEAEVVTPPAVPEPKSVPTPANISSVQREPDLWQRFRNARHWQPCDLKPGVERWIGRYAGSRTRFAATLEPALPLMDYVLTRSEELGLSSETMLLPIVESYYRPDARGPGGALGMWQLMPDTGRRFGLVPRSGADPRTDVIAATDAALELLTRNAETFAANPKLMYAAYNAGDYRLRKALRGRDMEDLDTLEGLGLTKTTRDYLDKVKALGCLLGEPERFDLVLPRFDPRDRLAVFRPTYAVDPESVFALAGMDRKFAVSINRTAAALGRAGPGEPLLVRQSALDDLRTADSGKQLAAAKPRKAPPPAAVATTKVATHRVVSGDSLWTISRRYRVKLADLMRWNGLTRRSVLRLGQEIRLGAG